MRKTLWKTGRKPVGGLGFLGLFYALTKDLCNRHKGLKTQYFCLNYALAPESARGHGGEFSAERAVKSP
jgi:hypothetical protein